MFINITSHPHASSKVSRDEHRMNVVWFVKIMTNIIDQSLKENKQSNKLEEYEFPFELSQTMERSTCDTWQKMFGYIYIYIYTIYKFYVL